MGEIITNHKTIMCEAKNEIKTLKEKVYFIETLLTNLVISQNNQQNHKKWLKSAEEYLQN